MGWYKKDNSVIYSTKNFHRYYKYFTQYYGTYLFVKYTKSLKRQLELRKEIINLSKDLESVLHSSSEAPELVTFEEMNLKRPDTYTYRVINALSRLRGSEQEAFLEHLPELISRFKRRAINEVN